MLDIASTPLGGRAPAEPAAVRDAVPPPPRTLVVGAGCSRGCPADELLALIDAALADAGLAAADVTALATVDLKGDEPAVLAVAEQRGWRLELHGAAQLAVVPVPTPSSTVAGHVGTPSVAEAAAILSSAGDLVVPKRKSANATCAIARSAA